MLNYLIILIVSISTYVSAKETKFEKRLQKDIKKLSRISGFIDNNLKLYDQEEISDKKNTIVVIFNHGQRDVGQIMKKNPFPVIVPCHRVVKSDGTVGGYAYGSERKKHMLSKEGLKINNDKISDFKKNLFRF